MRVYVDANVFLHAIGGDHRYRDPCRVLVEAMGAGAFAAETSAETLQEVVHHRLRMTDPDATGQARAVAAVCEKLHPLDAEVARAALDLIDANPRLWSRDAIHAATARSAGLRHLLSADSHFDDIPDVLRIDPLDSDAIAALVNE